MNIVDYMIIILLLIYISKGFINGVLKELITFIGGLAVIVLAFFLKNPVSIFMYQNLPFFKFGGIFTGISVLNIILYEVIAFLIVAGILLIIYKIILKVTNVIDKIIKITFIFELPSKLLGALVGFIEGCIFIFIILFVSSQIETTRDYIIDSKYGNKILTNTPILSKAISPIYNSIQEIYDVAENYKDSIDREKANLESLDILLKYRVLDIKNAEMLVENGKISGDEVNEILKKYQSYKSEETNKND